jgi:hypothetical protein
VGNPVDALGVRLLRAIGFGAAVGSAQPTMAAASAMVGSDQRVGWDMVLSGLEGSGGGSTGVIRA